MSETDSEWDVFLAACPLSHHEQSSQYAANRKAYGYHCDRVVVRENGDIVGGVQVLVQSTPVGRFAHIQRGPLALDDNPLLMRRVVDKLEELVRERSYASVRVDLFPNQAVAAQALKEAGFRPSKAWGRAGDSVIVPLTLSDDELMGKMDKKVSYNIRRSRRKGLSVQAEDEKSMDAFYGLHQETASYQDFPVFSAEYFSYVQELFGRAGKAQLFVAWHNEKPCAAIYNTIVGDHMYYGWGGMRRDPEAKTLRANYLLHMTAMAWAREHGCRLYDFVGNQPFKRWFAIEVISWPLPLRKFYGPAQILRWKLLEGTDSSPLLRRLINKASRKFGIAQTMPW
ncbi:lipid II:glycine glycyltransferase FemX [Desulfurivibrio alkaliphilus]|uniref:Methicillin resistance protein n=1 Tax=Desulfurivibrio alkaliphilus (strain DSM 19089 / UNIQEM U267 / AHT2) TaxID=589865 RepID=D6Z4I5_DESAT|nr:peptidoglycan bridge formation glycyltransferase FemA/FemB family protein [Desulfurivibrio alkaliphilus]ADH86460.1 Methicillin resistance protein [Desulfurivibrio alkaliphilus AHT 2]